MSINRYMNFMTAKRFLISMRFYCHTAYEIFDCYSFRFNYAFALCWNKINLLLALLNLLNPLLWSENIVAWNLTIFSRVDNIPNFPNWCRQEKDFRKSTFTNGILFEKHTNINYLYGRTKFKLIKEHDSDFACMRMRCTIANRISENWQHRFKEKIHRTKKHKVICNFIYVKIAGKWYKFSI